ncbi:MAG: NAD(P)-dependent oxidoreductase [Planctomycetota bacterium]
MSEALPKLGYVGLGIMGSAMAMNLAKAGYPLSVWNRTPEKAEPLVAAGARACTSPAEVAAQSEVVFLNLTDTPDVEQVLFAVTGVAAGADEKRGVVVVDHSTISPVATKAFAERLHEYGITFLDAPVSGGDVGAKAGTLSIMVGGPEDVFEELRPVFEVVGGAVTRVGDVGSGQACKACNQVAVLGALMGTCEAIALAKRLELDPSTMLEVVAQGAGGSWQLANLGPAIVEGDMKPGFFVDYLLKDLRLVQEAARSAGQALPVTAVAEQLMRSASAMGHGRDGTQAVSKVIEALGGGGP